jgi:HEAT repeat protein
VRKQGWGRSLWLPLCLGLCLTGVAYGQISSQQVRQRYDKSTKGASIEDYVKRLQSDDAEKRLEAVKSLGATKDNKAVEYLIQAMGDPDVRVQVKAIEMLGEMRATDATPVLIQSLFLRTTDPQMKQLILVALGKIGDTRAARPIIEFLQRDLDPATRGTAIFALGDISAPESVEVLSRLAESEDSDPTVRRLASEALNKVQAHQATLRKEVKGPSETFLEPKQPPPQ